MRRSHISPPSKYSSSIESLFHIFLSISALHLYTTPQLNPEIGFEAEFNHARLTKLKSKRN